MDHEIYAEWLVKRKAPIYALLLKVMVGTLLGASLVLSLGSPYSLLITLALAGIFYAISLYTAVEFEYLVLEGDFSVDRILAQSRRKKLLECKKEEIQILAPEGDYRLKEHEHRGMKTWDCTTRRTGAKVYCLIYRQGEQGVRVLFEPGEKLLRALKLANPRKVFE